MLTRPNGLWGKKDTSKDDFAFLETKTTVNFSSENRCINTRENYQATYLSNPSWEGLDSLTQLSHTNVSPFCNILESL